MRVLDALRIITLLIRSFFLLELQDYFSSLIYEINDLDSRKVRQDLDIIVIGVRLRIAWRVTSTRPYARLYEAIRM